MDRTAAAAGGGPTQEAEMLNRALLAAAAMICLVVGANIARETYPPGTAGAWLLTQNHCPGGRCR